MTNILGTKYAIVLTIIDRNGELDATIVDETDGEIDARAITYNDGVLRYVYARSPSQVAWQKGRADQLETWLKVDEDTFKGALTTGIDAEVDFSVTGHRVL